MKSTLTRLVVPFVVKAVAAEGDTNEPRTFEGHAATWDQDLGNDIIHKGAFTQAIKDWKSSGEALPLLNSHDHFDIFSALGQAVDMKEDSNGLWTKWEVIDGPEGDAVMRRLRPMKLSKRPLVGKMSIGFMPTKFDFEQPEGTDSFFDRIRHIREAALPEVSLVLFPMNPNASIDVTSVKHLLRAAKETDPRKMSPELKYMLRQLNGRIGNLLKRQTKSQEEPEDPAIPATPAAPKETAPSTPTPPSSPTPASPDPDDTGAGTQGSEATPVPPSAPPAESPEAKVYRDAEALQHRLQRTLLHGRISRMKDPA